MKKYTLEEIKSMFPKDNFFAFGTPLGTQAVNMPLVITMSQIHLIVKKLLEMHLFMELIGLLTI